MAEPLLAARKNSPDSSLGQGISICLTQAGLSVAEVKKAKQNALRQ